MRLYGEWETDNVQLVKDNYNDFINEFVELWKKDVIENAYFDPDAKINKLDYFPNITVFFKAKSLDEVKSILDKLILTKKGIAKYNVYPVGTKWLGRDTERIDYKVMANSYVAIWTTLKDIDQVKDANPIQEQADIMINLYKEGTAENVYWELSGEPDAERRRNNEIADFVFFVNAKSEGEAKNICNDLHLTKGGYVSYKLLPVGFFWLGKYHGTK